MITTCFKTPLSSNSSPPPEKPSPVEYALQAPASSHELPKIEWEDRSTSWMPLVDIKETIPVDVAEYAKANRLDKEPAFAWWVPHTLKKRDQIISAVHKRVRLPSTKYGIRVPQSTRQALEFDRINGDSVWQDAINKEMRNVAVAFKLKDDDERIGNNYKSVGFHMVFNIKMDFTRKARLVADGHKVPDPAVSTYSGVVSRESVRIEFTYAALNELDIMAADIGNAYLQAPTSSKYYTKLGPEFGPDYEGCIAYIVQAVYGLKEARADFRNHLRDCMCHLGYEPSNHPSNHQLRSVSEE